MDLSAIIDHEGFPKWLGAALTLALSLVPQLRRVIADVLMWLPRRIMDARKSYLEKNPTVRMVCGGLLETAERIESKVDAIPREVRRVVAFQRIARDSQIEPTFETDAEFGLLFVTRRVCEIFGTERDKLVGDRWLAFVDPVDRLRIRQSREQAIEAESDFREACWINREDGTAVKIEIFGRVLTDTETREVFGWEGRIWLRPPNASADMPVVKP